MHAAQRLALRRAPPPMMCTLPQCTGSCRTRCLLLLAHSSKQYLASNMPPSHMCLTAPQSHTPRAITLCICAPPTTSTAQGLELPITSCLVVSLAAPAITARRQASAAPCTCNMHYSNCSSTATCLPSAARSALRAPHARPAAPTDMRATPLAPVHM